MTIKIAISLPDGAVEQLRRKVKNGEASSVSAAVADLVAADTERETWAELLADLFAESGGPPTDEEKRWARKALDS